jgi:hypothetical protein
MRVLKDSFAPKQCQVVEATSSSETRNVGPVQECFENVVVRPTLQALVESKIRPALVANNEMYHRKGPRGSVVLVAHFFSL